MFRTLLLCVILAAVASVGLPRQASGQQPKKDMPKVIVLTPEERRFLLLALENLSRQLPEEVALPAATPGRRSIDATESLFVFVKQQELVFDTLRRHIERGNDRELEAVLPLYRKQLDEYTAFDKKVQTAMAEYLKRIRQQGDVVGTNVMLSGLGYALLAVADDSNSADVITRSAAAMFATSIEQGRRLKLYTEAEEAAFKETYKTAAAERQEAVSSARKAFGAKLKGLLDAENAEAKNPFHQVAAAQAVLRKSDATWKEQLAAAKVCRDAAKLVPKGEVYDLYRAAFLGAGGMLANAAAVKDCGATGIPLLVKNAPEAGPVARDIWNEYLNAEYNPKRTRRKDFSADFFQAQLLAQAYTGEAGDANAKSQKQRAAIHTQLKNVIVSNAVPFLGPQGRAIAYTLRKEFSNRPDFWFDCARVASILGDISLAMECLKEAVFRGFKDSAEAKVNPELRNVRESPITSAQFSNLFK